MAAVPADLQWQVIRKNSCFLHRQRGVKKLFSREPMNLKGVNSFRYNGLIHKRDVGVQPAKDGKGVEFLVRSKRHRNKPSKNVVSVTLKKDGRRNLKAIKNFMKKGHYKTSLHKLAMRRASQIMRGQRPVSAKKTRGEKKAKS